jgi:hypothetical protein
VYRLNYIVLWVDASENCRQFQHSVQTATRDTSPAQDLVTCGTNNSGGGSLVLVCWIKTEQELRSKAPNLCSKVGGTPTESESLVLTLRFQQMLLTIQCGIQLRNPAGWMGGRGGTIRKNDRANQQVIAYLVRTAIIHSE